MTDDLQQARIEAAAEAICETRPHSGGGSLVIYEDAVDFARAALAAADAHLPSVEQVQAEAWKEGYVAGFLKAMGGELDGSAREAVLPGLSTKGIGMIKCTHCGCELTSRLTVWVHVHSGSHQCDGGMDIGVPVMDARGRIVYQDAHGERAAEYRKEVGE